eukprot:scaffold18009_cov61-Phaeocystis_antarctica.AAC.1
MKTRPRENACTHLIAAKYIGAIGFRAPHARPSRWAHTTIHSRPVAYRGGLDDSVDCDTDS